VAKPGGFIPSPSLEQIKEKLDTIVPSGILPIPTFSAKKKDGKRSYDLARKGKAVEESKEMKIYSYKIINYEFPLLELEVDVGSGTYIRSIAHRLGEQFGLGGILTSLRRTKI
jgi:tRNA pseudouridine55 synthase